MLNSQIATGGKVKGSVADAPSMIYVLGGKANLGQSNKVSADIKVEARKNWVLTFVIAQ